MSSLNITICGGMVFLSEMQTVGSQLARLGHHVKVPRPDSTQTGPLTTAEKARHMRHHFEEVAWSDAILVINQRREGVTGHIGPNSFLEMGLAFHLGKPIYLYYQLPKPELPYQEEILAMQPVVIDGNLHLLDNAINAR